MKEKGMEAKVDMSNRTAQALGKFTIAHVLSLRFGAVSQQFRSCVE